VPTELPSDTLDIVRQVVELNCDGERLVTLSKGQVVRALDGSGLADDDIERALSELVERGQLVETDEGYRSTER